MNSHVLEGSKVLPFRMIGCGAPLPNPYTPKTPQTLNPFKP